MAQHRKSLAASNVHLTNCASKRGLFERRFQDTITIEILAYTMISMTLTLNFRACLSIPRLILVFSLLLRCNRVPKITFCTAT